MKTFGLVLALLVVGSSCIAATATFDVYPGWQTIACPLVPFDPSPQAVFDEFDFMFSGNILQRFDAASQSPVTLDGFANPDLNFGGILLGDGYSLYADVAGQTAITVTGVPDGVPGTEINPATGQPFMTDMWISLPAVGFNLIGHPFNHEVLIDPNGDWTGSNIKFTDGTTVKTWSEAVSNVDANGQSDPWVADSFMYYNPTAGVYETAGYFFTIKDRLEPGVGYYVQTMKPNLAVIIPAN